MVGVVQSFQALYRPQPDSTCVKLFNFTLTADAYRLFEDVVAVHFIRWNVSATCSRFNQINFIFFASTCYTEHEKNE